MTRTARVADRFVYWSVGPTVGWVVFGIAFLLRLGAGVFTGGLLHPEAFEYDQMARSLIAGHGLVFLQDRKSTRLNSSHMSISYAVFCLKKKKYITISVVFYI